MPFFGGRSAYGARTRRRLTKNAFASFSRAQSKRLTDDGSGGRLLARARTGRQTFTPPLELKNPMMSMATIRHVINQRFRIGNAWSACTRNSRRRPVTNARASPHTARPPPGTMLLEPSLCADSNQKRLTPRANPCQRSTLLLGREYYR